MASFLGVEFPQRDHCAPPGREVEVVRVHVGSHLRPEIERRPGKGIVVEHPLHFLVIAFQGGQYMLVVSM